jgi:hypothetical protein
MSDHASNDETVGYDVRNDNKSSDQCYPVRLPIIDTFFSAEGFGPDAPELSQGACSNTLQHQPRYPDRSHSDACPRAPTFRGHFAL